MIYWEILQSMKWTNNVALLPAWFTSLPGPSMFLKLCNFPTIVFSIPTLIEQLRPIEHLMINQSGNLACTRDVHMMLVVMRWVWEEKEGWCGGRGWMKDNEGIGTAITASPQSSLRWPVTSVQCPGIISKGPQEFHWVILGNAGGWVWHTSSQSVPLPPTLSNPHFTCDMLVIV